MKGQGHKGRVGSSLYSIAPRARAIAHKGKPAPTRPYLSLTAPQNAASIAAYSGNRADRSRSSTAGIQPGPSAFAAAITSWLRLMLMVFFVVPRGLPRLRLGWLGMSGITANVGACEAGPIGFVADQHRFIVVAVNRRWVAFWRVVDRAAVKHANRSFAIVLDQPNVAAALKLDLVAGHFDSPPLSGEAPVRHPLPIDIHYSENRACASIIFTVAKNNAAASIAGVA